MSKEIPSGQDISEQFEEDESFNVYREFGEELLEDSDKFSMIIKQWREDNKHILQFDFDKKLPPNYKDTLSKEKTEDDVAHSVNEENTREES